MEKCYDAYFMPLVMWLECHSPLTPHSPCHIKLHLQRRGLILRQTTPPQKGHGLILKQTMPLILLKDLQQFDCLPKLVPLPCMIQRKNWFPLERKVLAKKKCTMGSKEMVFFLPKLFWSILRKNCPSDRENLLKFEAEGREFSKNFR